MTLQTVMTFATGDAPSPSVLNSAQSVAALTGASLDVLCLGIDMTAQSYQYIGATVAVFPEALDRSIEDSTALAEKNRGFLKDAVVDWGAEPLACRLSDVERVVGGRARFSDVVVQGKPFQDSSGPDAAAIIEGALFDAGVPVLVVPEGADLGKEPGHVILCWDESREALTAARAALPLLKHADRVTVLIIDPPVHGPDRSDPGGPLSHWLARHGVRTEIHVVARTLPRVADVILREAQDSAADLVVMGAYGHSRFREALLGGATRDLLEMTNVPVFMAH